MQEEAKAKPLSFAVWMVITMLIHSNPIQSYPIARSPSPSPASGVPVADIVPEPSPEGIVDESTRMRGSFPGTSCNSKCNQCEPCMPVAVSVRLRTKALALDLEENYYPQVWKCICGDNIYSP